MTTATIYDASLVQQRRRRTNDEIAEIKATMVAILRVDQPMTLRGLFYRCVAAGVIDKTENGYQRIGAYLLQLRRSHVVPYHWIADQTRWQRKPRTYSGLQAALNQTAETYRRALWLSQPTYAEVWLEKDTLAGVLIGVTERWDVPLMVTRGYASETYLHEAAQTIVEIGKPARIFVLTDHDRAGYDIANQVSTRLTDFVGGAVTVDVERVAVTEQQIADLNLPTRPPKRRGDPDECVELDAIPAPVLRSLVAECITNSITDQYAMNQEFVTEQMERETLTEIASGWWAA